MSLKEVCKACLRTGQTMFPVLESIVPNFDSPPNSVVNLWKIFIKILITSEARLPDEICIECLHEIQQTYSFLLKCERSEEILKKMKHVRISLKNLKIVPVLNDSSQNNKSRNDLSSNISQNKTERIKTNNGCDEEDTYPRSQHNLMVRSEDGISKTKLLNQMDSEEKNSPKQDIKNESELDICMEQDGIESDNESSIEILKCPACRYESTIRKSLERHLMENHMKEQMCNLCNKEFVCKPIEHCCEHIEGAEGVLKANIIIHHKCKVCSKIFEQKRSLRRHLTLHMAERSHKCEICMKDFRRKSHLTRHFKCHKGERPFKCKICPKAFERTNLLTEHLRWHKREGEKPFKCEICPKTFCTKSNLSCHLIIHRGENPFKCMICMQTFSRRHDLTDHTLNFRCSIFSL